MTRIGRVGRGRRRPDLSAPSHERARQRAAERLDGPLEPAESAWLAEHLATCEPCRTVATAYEADRLALREMRAITPEPPRDLWARTAAAIEREASNNPASRRAASSRQTRFRPALGVASAVAVIAVVIGATALSGGFTQGPSTALVPTTSASAGVATIPGPTPIVVGAGSVGWVGTSDDGALAYNITPVSEVCPAREIDCARDEQRQTSPVSIATVPKSIIQSPGGGQAVVVGTDKAGEDAVIVIALPTATPTKTPVATVSPTSTPGIASASTEPSSAPTATPVVTATPTIEATPSPTPTTEATPSPTPTATATASPSATATAPITPSPTPVATPTPLATPEVTAATTLAIVSGVTVVGQSAAYSPDGRWFAFTARPANDSSGPDIYLWQVGQPLAKQVTNDHASVFASWVDTRMLGSRPNPDAKDGEGAASSFFMDPATGAETPIAGAQWRPVVDPTGKWVVEWEGSVKPAADGLTTVPSDGALVLRKYVSEAGPDVTEADPPMIAKGEFSDFDVRWDSTGTWIAVWVADPAHPTIGRLSLLHLDPKTGKLTRPAGGPDDVAALPGISIAKGRLAWATPPGQGGEGSRVQIVAWSGDTVGSTESDPVTDAIVVH